MGDFSALICVTTCNRLNYVARCVPLFASFCDSDPRFKLLLALDGQDPEYRDFCRRWRVPLLFSEAREGVGLSKNRVLQRFPSFDYYFFVEDDVELVDDSVFETHIAISRESGIHHFSLFERGSVRKPVGESESLGHRIIHALYGGAAFNFFTQVSLRRVGGWHPAFSEFRRWGHTEHSYRFPRAGLAPAPFNVVEDLSDAFIWHYPPAVTRHEEVEKDQDWLIAKERELIQAELEYVPLATISPFYQNEESFEGIRRLARMPTSTDRYPLLRGREKRRALADLTLWKGKTARKPLFRWIHVLRSALKWPNNPALKHYLKRSVLP